MNAPFRLTPLERQDPVWGRIRVEIENRIQQLRRENDQDLTETRTAHIRGKVAALTALLAIDCDPPVTE